MVRFVYALAFVVVAFSCSLIAQGLPAAATAKADQAPAFTPLEQAQRELVVALEELRRARAARADCEATLGPVEVQTRAQDLQRRYVDMKTAYETEHPGWTLSLEQGNFLAPIKKTDPSKDVKK